jgi:hypothetical protein
VRQSLLFGAAKVLHGLKDAPEVKMGAVREAANFLNLPLDTRCINLNAPITYTPDTS